MNLENLYHLYWYETLQVGLSFSVLGLLVLSMSGSSVSETKSTLWFSKCCLERDVNRKSAESMRYVHANVQSQQIQLSGLVYAQLIAKFYSNKKLVSTLVENR